MFPRTDAIKNDSQTSIQAARAMWSVWHCCQELVSK